MEFSVGMHQDQGKREYQQDAMSIKPFGSIGVLAILADGMGGYAGGEVASKLVSDTFREFSIDGENIGEALKKYLLKGNDAIKAYKEEHPEVKSMGTTAISFFMTDKSCQWVSVGDSPLYVIRDRSKIMRINENHSVAGLLDLQAKKGEITQEEALSSGQRHMLTSAVSGDDIPQIDVSNSFATKSDDIFILASDGIETISEDRIKEIVLGLVPVATQENMQKACEALVQDVVAQGTKNQDNVTVIMLARKVEDNDKTEIYDAKANASMIKKKEIKKVMIAGAILALIAILIGLYSLLESDDDNKEQTEGNVTVVVPEKPSPVKVTKPSVPVSNAEAKATIKSNQEANTTAKPIEQEENEVKKASQNNDNKKDITKGEKPSNLEKSSEKVNEKQENVKDKPKVDIKIQNSPTKKQIEQAKQDEAG